MCINDKETESVTIVTKHYKSRNKNIKSCFTLPHVCEPGGDRQDEDEEHDRNRARNYDNDNDNDNDNFFTSLQSNFR